MSRHRPDVRPHRNLVVLEPGRPEKTGPVGIGTRLQEHVGRPKPLNLLHELIHLPAKDLGVGVVHVVQIHLGGPNGEARREEPPQPLPFDPGSPVHHHSRQVPRRDVPRECGNIVQPEGHCEAFLGRNASGRCILFPVRPGEDRHLMPQFFPENAPRFPKILQDARQVLPAAFVTPLIENVPPRGDGTGGVPEGVGRLVPVKTVAVRRDLHQAALVHFLDLFPGHQGREILRRIVDEGGDD